jgi:hypothetical protein
MDGAKVIPALLETLDKSPLWPWDSAPTIWAVINADPAVILPAMVVPSLGHVVGVAEAWRDQLPADSVPTEALVLIHEGWVVPNNDDGTPQEGVRHEVRDAILAEKDGAVSMFRHTRNVGIEEVELDPTGATYPSVEAMRQVAASSWRD